MQIKPTIALAALLLLPTAGAAQFSSVRVQVIDVGQADGILIRTPNSEWVLIEAGQNGLLADSLPTHFEVDSLALVVGSHRHFDHIGGMDEVLESLPVGTYVADTIDRPGPDFDDLVTEEAREEIVQGPGADTVEIDGVRFIMLPQPPRQPDSDENENSITVRLEFGDFTMLFPGDLEHEGQEWLIENHAALLDVEVLKAAHHGADNGWSREWLDAVTPEHVVISAGLHRGFEHPRPDAVMAYDSVAPGRVFCTNRHGTIRVYGFPDGRVRIFKQRAEVTRSCAFDGTLYDGVEVG